MAFYVQRPLTEELRARLRSQPKVSSPFFAKWHQTLELLRTECAHLSKRGTDVVMMIDIEERDLRIDGELRANAKPMSPNVAVALETTKGALTFPCGRFYDWQDNVRAIALGMEALRKVDRYGISPNAEQYRGWQALPPGMPMPAASMTVEEAARLLADVADLGYSAAGILTDTTVARCAYRDAVKRHHPDAGGDADMFRKLTEARDLLVAS